MPQLLSNKDASRLGTMLRDYENPSINRTTGQRAPNRKVQGFVLAKCYGYYDRPDRLNECSRMRPSGKEMDDNWNT